MGESWSGRQRRRRKRGDDVPQLSADDVAARIGDGPSKTKPAPDEAGPAVATVPVAAPPPRRVAPDPPDRGRILWWDTATIVAGVMLSLIALQLLGSPAVGPLPTEEPTEEPSQVAIRTLAPPVTLPPAETLGPIVDPSLGLDRTPTPIPVITLGPTPKPTPTPAPPVATFSYAQAATSLKVTFTSTSSGDITSYRWTFGDGTTSILPNPVRTYAAPGTYTVRLTVTGPGGMSTKTRSVTVVAPPTAPPPSAPPPSSAPPPTASPPPPTAPPPTAPPPTAPPPTASPPPPSA